MIVAIQEKAIDPRTLVSHIYRALLGRRFTARVEVVSCRRVKITEVRLTEKKLYCGNHPCACENPFQKHICLPFLEGADWVEFNDLLNDLLDGLKVPAKVWSGVVNVRDGWLRRVYYREGEFIGGAWQWDRQGENSDWADSRFEGLPPHSEFPIGTPGIHTKADYFCVG